MTRLRLALAAALAAALAGTALPAAAGTAGERLRIFYAEAVDIAGLDARASAAAAADAPRSGAATGAPLAARFDAYGRRFELALENNARLVPSLASLPNAPQLYRGTLAGQPGSWVRLTVAGARRWGMIWDGRDLYVVEPAADAAESFVGPAPATGEATVVYRLSDTETPAGSSQCGAIRPGDVASGLDAYTGLVAELRNANGLPDATAAAAPPTAAAVTPTRRLQVSVVGDFQYVSRFGGATDRVLSRFNNVDGIFSTQVGVQIEVVSATMLATQADSPFSSTIASERLTELSNYRRARTALTSTGLTHLVTGADVTASDGTRSTVGIAYIGSLCSSRFGASLSEGSTSSSLDSLVMAHEIGHNFGAEHDGEQGSVCATTPTTFLMAPTLNRSDQFSQCSLDSISREVAGAACLLPANLAAPDLSVTAGTSPASVVLGREFTLAATVANIGGAAASNAQLQYSIPAGLEAVSASAAAGGTCAAQAGGIACTWPTFAAGSNAAVNATLRAVSAGSYTIGATATASGDVASGNDAASWTTTVAPPPDLALELPLATAATGVGQDASLVANVRNAGTVAASALQVSVTLPSIVTVQAVSPASACTAAGGTVTCSYASIAAGETLSITITARGASTGSGDVQYSISSPDDGTSGNNAAALAVTVTGSTPPPPPPPPPPTTPATSGGGGGGGALGGYGLLALAGLAWLRVRRPRLIAAPGRY